MISAVSPSADDYDETLSTLRYADRAKRIVNKARVNEDEHAGTIRELRDELDALRSELAKARESAALSDRLRQSEQLCTDMERPWQERLADTAKIQREWSAKLNSMGIANGSSNNQASSATATDGIRVDNNKFYLVNLNADPSMNELLVYYLNNENENENESESGDRLTLVGRSDAPTRQHIQLMGSGIHSEHCAFYIKPGERACVAPIREAKTWVNGKLIRGETYLQNGDRIVLGVNHFFRINCPASSATGSKTEKAASSSPSSSFRQAQEELMLHGQLKSDSEDGFEDYSASSSASSSNPIDCSTSDANELTAAICKFERDYASIPLACSASRSLAPREDRAQFERRVQNLREKLVRANCLVREANALCSEMCEPVAYRVTMHIPAQNLTPQRDSCGGDSLLCEPAVVVRHKDEKDCKTVVDFNTFENYMFQLREAYAMRLRVNISSKVSHNKKINTILKIFKIEQQQKGFE